jgi:hypothetical protein
VKGEVRVTKSPDIDSTLYQKMPFISRVKSFFKGAAASEKNETLADVASAATGAAKAAALTPANRIRGGADDNDVACLVFIFDTLGFNTSDTKSMHDKSLLCIPIACLGWICVKMMESSDEGARQYNQASQHALDNMTYIATQPIQAPQIPVQNSAWR